MNFELSEEHLAVKEAARDFAQNVLKPGVIERDNKQKEEQLDNLTDFHQEVNAATHQAKHADELTRDDVPFPQSVH